MSLKDFKREIELMYEALVARVRYHIQKAEFMGLKEAESTLLLKEAADAIEELSAYAELYQDISEKNARTARKVIDAYPRWIPVTERKPKTDDIVIVAIHDDSGDTPYDVTNVGFYLDVFPLGIWIVENERCNYVTHWMPLPQPPKEEEA